MKKKKETLDFTCSEASCEAQFRGGREACLLLDFSKAPYSAELITQMASSVSVQHRLWALNVSKDIKG